VLYWINVNDVPSRGDRPDELGEIEFSSISAAIRTGPMAASFYGFCMPSLSVVSI
jgi:hypothetical protein